MKVSASVYMTLKIEVLVGNWDAAQSFADLHKQAERGARQALTNLFDKSSGKYRMVNEPATMHVVTKETDD